MLRNTSKDVIIKVIVVANLVSRMEYGKMDTLFYLVPSTQFNLNIFFILIFSCLLVHSYIDCVVICHHLP